VDGTTQTPGTLETQLRYVSHAPGRSAVLYARLMQALRAIPHTALVRETKPGKFWLRVALGLLITGIIAGSEFLLVAGVSVLAYVGLGWLWDGVSLDCSYARIQCTPDLLPVE